LKELIGGENGRNDRRLVIVVITEALLLGQRLAMHPFQGLSGRQAVAMSAHLQAPQYDPDRLEQLLTISDVARLLGVSRGSVYGLMRMGELVPIRISERARFTPADIREYLERHREAGP
jgi:excisionase family DNA binding protein